MEMKLAENVRAIRRQRKLTQEQLAEALGVTTGAVYKWEAGLSLPELPMLMELADFFDVSVDALLGYGRRDNREEAIIRRLGALYRSRDPQATAEAEKALVKYPNSFPIVHECALVYCAFGAGDHSEKELRRALELLERSRLLIAQNTDPQISEQTICGEIAGVYLLLGEGRRGVELMKQQNAGGLYNDSVGTALAVFMDQPEEAEPFLSRALLQSASALLNSAVGYAFLFRSRGDWASMRQILRLGLDLLEGVKKEGVPDYLDKVHAELYALLAAAQSRSKAPEEAGASMEKAAELVRRFDAAPYFGLETFRFIAPADNLSAHDSLGVTAAESVENLLRRLGDPAMEELWKEAYAHE